MRVAGAAAGMVTAAMLLTPGCGPEGNRVAPAADEPLRLANFRSLAARDFLLTCDGGAGRIETAREIERFGELTQFALRKGGERALWLSENDWASVSRIVERGDCAPGEGPYGTALAQFGGTLDALAGQIAAYPQ